VLQRTLALIKSFYKLLIREQTPEYKRKLEMPVTSREKRYCSALENILKTNALFCSFYWQKFNTVRIIQATEASEQSWCS
jgi:hypothetical protein